VGSEHTWNVPQQEDKGDKGAAAKKKVQVLPEEKQEYEDMEVPDHWLPLTLFLVSPVP
jgi:hypothetical protein